MNSEKLLVPVGVSNRHIHLSRADLDTLFGKGYEPRLRNPLRQPGQYAAEEVVTLVGAKRRIENVRVLCPLRIQTQVELSVTDAISIGIDTVLRQSGDLAGSASVRVEGPAGRTDLLEGAIVAARHVHLDPDTAARYGIEDNEFVDVKCGGERAVVFYDLLARVRPEFVPEVHFDTDEANAAMLHSNQLVEIIRKQGK